MLGHAPSPLPAQGEVLVQQGQPTSTMFLLTQGTLLATKTIHGKTRHVGTLKPGQIIGELSFLLGSTPVVSVSAPATLPVADDGGSRAPEDLPPAVCHLSHEDLGRIVKGKPTMAQQFFEALAASVAQHLQETSKSMLSMLGDQDSGGGGGSRSDGDGADQDDTKRSPLEVASAFGLEEFFPTVAEAQKAMVGSCHGVQISMEEHSTPTNAEVGRLYLFSTHLCIERNGPIPWLLFARRDVIDLIDGVLPSADAHTRALRRRPAHTRTLRKRPAHTRTLRKRPAHTRTLRKRPAHTRTLRKRPALAHPA
jgi:CRP-like cAMP-binding protein